MQPDDEILEVGCGRGAAASLICSRLQGGRLLAIDRSATAIAAASARNAEHLAAGRMQLRTTALDDLDTAGIGSFDRILAVNVNLFWVRPAQTELKVLTGLLRRGGQLWLCYDPPGTDRAAQLEATLPDHLGQAGYRCATITGSTERSTLLAVRAEPPAQST